MAFLKFANAPLIATDISLSTWGGVRDSASTIPSLSNKTAGSRLSLGQFTPEDFMLSHVTIMASVDTEAGPGVLGQQIENDESINRAYRDYYITQGTDKYINSNLDSWERKLLLASAPTFVGGDNFVEHVQIPSLSKGKILDVVSRDIGDSVYVDLLVATNRKHAELVESIRKRQLTTLSMGCFTADTLVTLSDGTRAPISSITPGQKVITHKGRPKEVAALMARQGDWGMRRVEVVGLETSIESTDNHLFFVIRPGLVIEEVRADSLLPGDLILSPLVDGVASESDRTLFPIKAITPFTFTGTVFDLEVEEDHSYLVQGLAVHNCVVKFTICTQCGNRAKDSSELCQHIKYYKGNQFTDQLGNKRRAVELCGHIDEEPGSVVFKEASWVGHPAFPGAVLRSFLTPEAAEKYATLHKPRTVISFHRPSIEGMSRAAKVGFDFGQQDDSSQQQSAPPTPPEPKNPLDGVVDDAAKAILNKAVLKVRKDLSDSERPTGSEDLNPTLTKEASNLLKVARAALVRTGGNHSIAIGLVRGSILRKVGGWAAVASAGYSAKSLLGLSYFEDSFGDTPSVDPEMYRVVLAVGGPAKYPNVKDYLTACKHSLGRNVTVREAQVLVEKGKIFDLGH